MFRPIPKPSWLRPVMAEIRFFFRACTQNRDNAPLWLPRCVLLFFLIRGGTEGRTKQRIQYGEEHSFFCIDKEYDPWICIALTCAAMNHCWGWAPAHIASGPRGCSHSGGGPRQTNRERRPSWSSCFGQKARGSHAGRAKDLIKETWWRWTERCRLQGLAVPEMRICSLNTCWAGCFGSAYAASVYAWDT